MSSFWTGSATLLGWVTPRLLPAKTQQKQELMKTGHSMDQPKLPDEQEDDSFAVDCCNAEEARELQSGKKKELQKPHPQTAQDQDC